MLYRKYFEPDYGEAAPWVRIDPPETVDMKSMSAWRKKHNSEVSADLGRLMRDCNCYDALTEIETEDVRLEREDGEEITLRVYRPLGDGPFPVMVFYHGGGWAMNNIDIYEYPMRYFARFGGIAVVSVDYRLAPEYKFPVGLEDCYAATVWAWENAARFDGDVSRFMVCGDSAGGNFAAAISLMARDRKGPVIGKQVLIYPATSFNLGERPKSELRYGNGGYFISVDSSKGPNGNYLPDPEKDKLNPYVSPMEETNFEGVAPACFISAECDPILDQALMYAAKLEDNGVAVEFNLYKGMLHAFFNRTYQSTFEAFDAIIAACPPKK